MIDCLKCSDWFHTSCIDYICEECSALTANTIETHSEGQEENEVKTGDFGSERQTSTKVSKKQKSAMKITEEALIE